MKWKEPEWTISIPLQYTFFIKPPFSFFFFSLSLSSSHSTSAWDPSYSFHLSSFAFLWSLAILTWSPYIQNSLLHTFCSLIMLVPSWLPGMGRSKLLFQIPAPNSRTSTCVSFMRHPTPSSGLLTVMLRSQVRV